jgi:predicted ABC-class ATPase
VARGGLTAEAIQMLVQLQEKEDASITHGCVDPTAPPHVLEARRKELTQQDAYRVQRVSETVNTVKEPNTRYLRSLGEWEELAKQTKEMLIDAKANSTLFHEIAGAYKENMALQKELLLSLRARAEAARPPTD